MALRASLESRCVLRALFRYIVGTLLLGLGAGVVYGSCGLDDVRASGMLVLGVLYHRFVLAPVFGPSTPPPGGG